MTRSLRPSAVLERPRTDPNANLEIRRQLDRHEVLLREILARLTPAANVSADPADRRLWVELVRVMADRTFTAADVRSTTAIDPALAGAIQDADVNIADDARQVGHWLRRMAAGGAVDGLELVRVDEYDRAGLVWRLRVVTGFATQNPLGAE